MTNRGRFYSVVLAVCIVLAVFAPASAAPARDLLLCPVTAGTFRYDLISERVIGPGDFVHGWVTDGTTTVHFPESDIRETRRVVWHIVGLKKTYDLDAMYIFRVGDEYVSCPIHRREYAGISMNWKFWEYMSLNRKTP